MRSYIFTSRERQALYNWIANKLHREQDPCLHSTLNRLTKHKQQANDPNNTTQQRLQAAAQAM